jgi:hypothetical protein
MAPDRRSKSTASFVLSFWPRHLPFPWRARHWYPASSLDLAGRPAPRLDPKSPSPHGTAFSHRASRRAPRHVACSRPHRRRRWSPGTASTTDNQSTAGPSARCPPPRFVGGEDKRKTGSADKGASVRGPGVLRALPAAGSSGFHSSLLSPARALLRPPLFSSSVERRSPPPHTSMASTRTDPESTISRKKISARNVTAKFRVRTDV